MGVRLAALLITTAMLIMAALAPAQAAEPPSIGVKLEKGETTCEHLRLYDAWATGKSAEEFNPCGYVPTSSTPFNGGVSGIVGGKSSEWQQFTGPPSDPTWGRVSIELIMQPVCVKKAPKEPEVEEETEASAVPTFREECKEEVPISEKDRAAISAHLEDAVIGWCAAGSTGCRPETPECSTKTVTDVPPKSYAVCNWAPYYEQRATELIENGDGNAYLKLGSEAEGGWYPWQYGPNVEAWKEYYSKIAEAMDAVHNRLEAAGEFKFVWVMGLCEQTENLEKKIVPAEKAWPGPFTTAPGRTAVPDVGLDFHWTDICESGPFEASKMEKAEKEEKEASHKKAWETEWEYMDKKDKYGFPYWVSFAEKKDSHLALTQWNVANDNFVLINDVAQFLFGPGPERGDPHGVLFSDYYEAQNGRLEPKGGEPGQPYAAACYIYDFFAAKGGKGEAKKSEYEKTARKTCEEAK